MYGWFEVMEIKNEIIMRYLANIELQGTLLFFNIVIVWM